MTNQRIDQYLKMNFYRTEGYMSRLDALVFRELIVGQSKEGIAGSLVEIGVHYGRSFFLLASGRCGSEKSLAVDLFEDDALHMNRGGVGRVDGFRNNCGKYGVNLSGSEILKGSSLELSAEEILRRVGKIRFFSIDGGHMYEHLANDLQLAGKVLTPEGIICLDDMFSALWPEVAIATFDWLRIPGNRFVPFLATKEKLYLCESHRAAFYLAMIRGDERLNSRVFRSISLLSHEVAVLLPSVTSRLLERSLDSLYSIGRRLSVPKGNNGRGANTALPALSTPKNH
jgi:Methyltransferase domain